MAKGEFKTMFRRATRVLVTVLFLCAAAMAQGQRWTEQQAKDWYAKQGWLVGANYNPASAINAIEMWQADTFDPKRIDLELGWAEDLGMNTMRVTCTTCSGSRTRKASRSALTSS